jgi:hypothetical protein
MAPYPAWIDSVFSLCGALVLPCWLLLAFAPRWKYSQRLATFVAPLLIAAAYVVLLMHPQPVGAGFGSLAQVARLFVSPYALCAGWIHYLAFDLFTGAWEARDAARLGLPRWLVAPFLLLTFLFGPAGLALYLLLRLAMRGVMGVDESRGAA